MDIEEFSKIIPKVDLHSHLAGSINLDLLKKCILEKYPNKFDDIIQKCRINSSETRELSHCFEIFKWIHDVFNDLEKLSECVKVILSDFYSENCVLLELRSTPRKMKGSDEKQYISTILDTILNFMKTKTKNDFFCGFLFSINRSKSLETAYETLRLYKEFKKIKKYQPLILGIEFSGNCFDHSFSYYEKFFSEVKKEGIPTSIHFAEKEDDHEDSLKILDYQPQRIGHACYLNNKIRKKMLNSNNKNKRIPLEVCLTSNILSRSVKRLEDHQFKYFYKENDYPVCLNTDDMGVFSTSITEEYRKAFTAFDLKKKDLLKITKMGIEMSFFNEDVKQKAREIVKKFEMEKM